MFAHNPELLEKLDFARDNGSAGLESAAQVLETALRDAGLAPDVLRFACRSGRAEMAALLLCVGAIVLGGAAWRRSRRLLAAAGTFVLLALAAGAGFLDAVGPATPQTSLQVVVEPLERIESQVVLSAHYDTKTELFDHVERAVVLAAAGLLGLGTAVLVLLRRGAARAVGSAAMLALLLGGVHLVAGRFHTAPSHGIVDDGAACALLVEIASQLQPLRHTRVRFLWFSGEEVGAQGSARFVEEARAAGEPAAVAMRVVNLEAVGAGPELALLSREWTAGGPRTADKKLAASLERAAARRLRRLPYPIQSDAGPFLRAGIPAVTLINLPAGARTIRHLHGPGDRLPAFDPRGYEATRETLRAFLSQCDADP